MRLQALEVDFREQFKEMSAVILTSVYRFWWELDSEYVKIIALSRHRLVFQTIRTYGVHNLVCYLHWIFFGIDFPYTKLKKKVRHMHS